MSTTSDLIRRLRAYVESEHYVYAAPLCKEAADELEAQIASQAPAAPAQQAAPEAPTDAEVDDLIRHALRYGDTPEAIARMAFSAGWSERGRR